MPGGEPLPTQVDSVPSSVGDECPHCRASRRPGDTRCWLCGAIVERNGHTPLTDEPNRVPIASSGGFSLATLMMFMTLVAVVCGLIGIAPGIGIALAAILLPGLAHTAISVRGEQAKGRSLTSGDQVVMFFGSLSLVVVAGVAASIAFGITCYSGFFAGAATGEALGARGDDAIGWGAVAGLGLGTIAAAFVGYRAMVWLSRRRGQQPLSRRSKIILAITFALAVIGAGVAIAIFELDW